MPTGGKPRLLILIVAYNAETTISQVLVRVPRQLATEYDVEVLVLDDSSQDRTFEQTRHVQRDGVMPFPLHVLFNPVNQGYGGNQKIGYHYALERGFDFVALVHGDGQYAPECLPELVRPLRDGEADAVFGSRMLEKGGARRGGMPLYKFVGNRILSWFQNRMLGTALSEFHSGYRVYSVAALAKIPFAAEHQRLSFRHRDHHSVRARGAADRRAADPDLLRRRDLPRERPQVRLGRHEGRAGGAIAAARGCSTTAASIARRAEESRTTSRSSITSARTRRRSRWCPRGPACSISVAPADTWARCCAGGAAAG